MIETGQFCTLVAVQELASGWFLEGNGDRVLLPARKVPAGLALGDSIRVFVTTDSDDKRIATTDTPKAVVGDFALLTVVDESRHGAFLDWGLEKDLLVPTKEQFLPLRVGDQVVVAVVLDRDERVMGTSRLAPFFDKRTKHLQIGQEVDFLIYASSERGWRVIADKRHSGMLYHDQTFRKVAIGQTGRAWITEIRRDGRLDLSTRPPGGSIAQDARRIVLDALRKADGHLPLNDRSPPHLIAERLQISKKAFKRAIGGLYKERKISIDPDGIRWVG